MENFQNELGKRENEKKNYWSEARNLPLERDVFFAVLIPAYIAYDAFECDFQTNLLFKRIRYHQEMDDCNYWAPLAMDFDETFCNRDLFTIPKRLEGVGSQ